LFTYLLYGAAGVLLFLSWRKDRSKTKLSLKKAWKSFENILPQFLTIILMVGMLLAALNPDIIASLIGGESGWLGMLLAAVIGSITLIPGFVAFPLASALLQGGAGFVQIAVFISTLMMVGIVTMPVEIATFGKKATFVRNGLAFGFSFVVAMVIGWVM
jgi:uncharacterized membrane protein YraQ (UPF0718 family)